MTSSRGPVTTEPHFSWQPAQPVLRAARRGSARRSTWLLIAGGALVAAAGTFAQADLSRAAQTAPAPLAPGAASSVLAAPQSPRDVVDDPRVPRLVRPETTRYLGTTSLGPQYLGIGTTGDVCVLTLREDGGEIVPDTGCATFPSDDLTAALEMSGPGGRDVALVPDGYEHDASWTAIGPNLLVRT